MSLILHQVDAFAEKPFEGNPAAVCLLPEARPEAWMQSVAAEMNLSETAFLVRREDGSFDLRWFTPAIEVPLCGHATLASAHSLWEAGVLGEGEEARFHTKSGLLTASRLPDGRIAMDFPSREPKAVELPPEVPASLGSPAVLFAGREGAMDFLLELESEEAIRALRPDFGLMRRAARQLVVTTAPAAGGEFDFVSRVFAPGSGIDEDPVTGSAHCMLAPYWAKRLGKAEMLGRQISPRGGTVGVRVNGDRTVLSGRAVSVARIELSARASSC